MNNVIRIGLAQTNAVLGDKESNIYCLEQYCHKANQNNAQIICFPELATTGYSPAKLGKDFYALSESRGEQMDLLFSRLATTLNITIVCGFIERDESTGKIYNSAGVWVPGENSWIGTFRKIHLINDEKPWFTPGDQLPVFDTKICRIGVMICYDAGFPEVSRILTLKNAEILFLLSAWPEKDKDLWYINGPCRALENSIHLGAVNRWGKEEDDLLFGGSQILGPRGQVLAKAPENSESIIYYDINFDLQVNTRKLIPYLVDRRPEIYI